VANHSAVADKNYWGTQTMKPARYLSLFTVVVLITCSISVKGGPSPNGETDREVIVRANNKFGLELYAKLCSKDKNLFFSPYSISTALAMAYAGARNQTQKQMSEVLHFPAGSDSTSCDAKEAAEEWDKRRLAAAFGAILKDLNKRARKGGYELSIANALWGQKGHKFLDEFIELTKTEYDGAFNTVDFVRAAESARKIINSWAAKKTKDKIKNLIGPGTLNSRTRLVLTNAIYFKGNWARQFDKDKTKNKPFTLLSGKKVSVPMMNQTAVFKYMETEDFQALELPYVDNDLSMLIFLPKQTDGLVAFEQSLTAEKLSRWFRQLRKQKVIVSIPRFKMTSRFGLAGVLRSMGMTDAFSEKADFSGMNGQKNLFISAVIHKAYVDVNEEGTEAAAATSVIMGITSVGPSQIPVFRADHPFLFLIRDNHSQSILFVGRVANPK